MSWLTNFVLPKIRAVVAKKDVPENLWQKCANCGQMLFSRDLEAGLHVCGNCGHHLRLAPQQRLDMLFDDGRYSVIELPKAPIDPLKFRDLKRYADRLKDAQAKAGRPRDAMLVAHGLIGGLPAVTAVFDFEFLGGSMGMAVGEALLAAGRLAVLQEAALVVVPASGGARMQEGILSLVQMAKVAAAIALVRDAGVPYLSVMCDPTTGGVAASFAMLGDLNLAEPGALIGFAGRRVIEQTTNQQLPGDFQRAEFLLAHGMLDAIVPRRQMRPTLARLLRVLRPQPARTRRRPQPGTALILR